MKIAFSTVPNGEIFGTLEYDEATKKLTIDASGDVSVLKDYLTKQQRFKIPESQRIDDFRVDKVRPTKNKEYLTQALCSAYARTGFWMLWDTWED